MAKRMERNDFEGRKKLLQSMRDESPVDKRQLQVNLYIAQGKISEAAKLTEEHLLSASNKIHILLITLMEIAVRQKRLEDAEYIADVDKQCAKILDQWEYNTYVAEFDLYSSSKQYAKCLEMLFPMLRSLKQKWEINKSPLYRHIQTKTAEPEVGKKMQKRLIQSLLHEKQMECIKDSPEVKKLMSEENIEINE